MDSVNQHSEESIKTILTQCYGDLFMAAQQLGITSLQMSRFVEYNPAIGAHFAEIQRIKREHPSYEKETLAWFADRLQRQQVMYRAVGYEVLAEIAMAPAKSAAAREVKRKAANNLKGEEVILRSGSEMDAELAKLNAEYERDAPRIKETRERLAARRQGALIEHGPTRELPQGGNVALDFVQTGEHFPATAGVGADS